MGIENVDALKPNSDEPVKVTPAHPFEASAEGTPADDSNLEEFAEKTADVTDPHPTDENPEEHIGADTPDPWSKEATWTTDVDTQPMDPPKEGS